MSCKHQVKILSSINDFLSTYELLKELYGQNWTIEHYNDLLQEMQASNYSQIAIFIDEECVAVSGIWIGTKLWCGKYLEIDNFVVSEKHRNKKLGTILVKEIERVAVENKVKQICLDAYVDNFVAQKFYINQGFIPRGFHYIKWI